MPWKRRLMHTENEGKAWRKSSGRTKSRGPCGKGGFCLFWKPLQANVIRKIRAQRPRRFRWAWQSLRAQTLESDNQNEAKSQHFFLAVWAWARPSGLHSLHLHKPHRIRVRSQYILKHWAQSKNLAYVIKCSINHSCIIVNIMIR